MRARRADLLLCLSVAGALAVVVSSDQGRGGDVNPVAYLWAAGLGCLMLIRRSNPRLVLALTALGFLSYHAAGFPSIGVAVPIAASLYSAAEMGFLRSAVVTGLFALAVSTTYRVAAGQDAAFVFGDELVYHCALIAAVILLGHSVRATRRLRWRTDQVTRLLERQRAMDADARVQQDRYHLARELHDSIGHSLSIASLYTDIAREAGPDEAKRVEALGLARSRIVEALSHLRRTVKVLREPGHAPGEFGPRVEDLPSLLDGPAAAGYQVRMDIDQSVYRDGAPPEVEAAAFRVVQEAVTNTLRHSTGTRIDVQVVSESGDRLVVCIKDDGRAAPSPDTPHGHGLRGMCERVMDLGGTFDAGPTHDGWLVRAELPTGGTT
jgi:signal transduction histidine kinase